MKRYGDITSFGAALDTAMKQHNLQHRIREHELLERWEELVGKPIANYAHPQKLLNGTLVLQVTDAIWRQEISLKRTELIEAINARLESDVVSEIVLR